jgi:hypothetical protein
MWFIIWVLLIVLCKIDSCPTHFCSLLEVLNQNLKFHQMDFLFESLNIHMNEKAIICHDCHGFKWQNINIYQFFIVFVYSPMPFLAHWIVITPMMLSFDKSLCKILEWCSAFIIFMNTHACFTRFHLNVTSCVHLSISSPPCHNNIWLSKMDEGQIY